MVEPRELHQLSIEWQPDDDKPAHVINHATLLFDGSLYTLRLYLVLPPLTVDEKTTSVPARHVGTFVISAGDMPAIRKLINSIGDHQES